MEFNMLTRVALGIFDMNTMPFNQKTLFNFMNRIKEYHHKENINLFEKVFDNLTKEQLDLLNIKTDIQRTDSVELETNIRNYGRIELLVEMLIRIYRMLDKSDKEALGNDFTSYIKSSAQQYIYTLKKSDIPHSYKQLCELYSFLYERLKDKYSSNETFHVFERLYDEHFKYDDDKLVLKANEELDSGILQSPDDLDATFRKKRGKKYRGVVANICETANPDNEINLITDVVVEKNNVDDSVILNGRLDKIKEKAPDLNEMHTDGAYGSPENDEKMESLGITHVQTAMKGRKKSVDFVIEELPEGNYIVSCPKQSALSSKARVRNKCVFDINICKSCSLQVCCPAKECKNGRKYYFSRKDYLRNKRSRNIELIAYERRKLRPNVEATICEVKGSMKGKKLKVRGLFKSAIYAYSMAISINFGRIYRLIGKSPKIRFIFEQLFAYFHEKLLLYRKLLIMKHNFLLKKQYLLNIL